MCQICTIAVGAGLGLSRWLGVSDAISGIWVGALILSSSLWFSSWLIKKFPATRYLSIIASSILFIITLLSLYFTNLLTNKLVIGIATGSLTFLLGIWADKKVRKIKGRQLFNFQKVVFPVVLLLISSLTLWIITKR